MSNAKLIVLEGNDASGKSTQIQLIVEYFKKNNFKYESLHLPLYETNEAGKVISAYLRGEYGEIDNVNPIFVANIYAMNRFLYLPELQKQLNNNDVVLLDRYVFSNMAFQGAKYNTDTQAQIIRNWIDEFEFGFLELPYPDLNIFFDVPLELIEDRLNQKREGVDREYLNGKIDIHEKNIEYQNKVRDNYLTLKSYDNFEIIECAKQVTVHKASIWAYDEEIKYETLRPEEIFKKYEHLLDKIMLIPK